MDKNSMNDISTEVGKLKDVSELTILGSRTSSPKKFHNYSNGCCSRSLVKLPEHRQSRLADSVDAAGFEEPPWAQREELYDEPQSLPTVEAWMPVDRDSNEYNMNHPRRGLAVIFNHEEFDLDNLSTRNGSNIDVKNLEELYTYLGFDIMIHHNKCSDEIKDIIVDVAKQDHSDADCIVITILSHGLDEKYIWAKDNIYGVESLCTPFTADKCPTLAGKPKLFFIQACRGERLDPGVKLTRKRLTETDLSSESRWIPLALRSNEGVDSLVNLPRSRRQTDMDWDSESFKIPTQADFLLVFSSADGYCSFRNPESGTWFIESMCKEIKQNAHNHDLLKLLTIIARRVALDYESYDDIFPEQHKQKQVPKTTTTLIREVYFRPKESNFIKKTYFCCKKWYIVFLDSLYRGAHYISSELMPFFD